MPITSPIPVRTRLDWIDHARGLGILLVVVGHVLGGLPPAGVLAHSSAAQLALAAIYAFHMPLFFFLSGLFADAGAGGLAGLRGVVGRKVRTIAYPYVLWSVLQTLAHVAAAPVANQRLDAADLLRIAYVPVMQFWFLYALFVIAVLHAAGRAARLSARSLTAGALLLYAWAHLVGLGPWGVAYSVANHLPYYALGAVLGDPLRVAGATPLGRGRGALGLAAVALAGAGVAGAAVAGLTASPWSGPLVACLGIAATLAAARLTAGVTRLGVLAHWGRQSLPIYVAHTAAAAAWRTVLLRGLHSVDPFLHVVGGTAGGLLLPLLLDAACRRVGFRYAFQWPARRPDFERHARRVALPLGVSS